MNPVRLAKNEFVEVLDSLSEEQVVRTPSSVRVGWSMASTGLSEGVTSENAVVWSPGYSKFATPFGQGHVKQNLLGSFWPSYAKFHHHDYVGVYNQFTFGHRSQPDSYLLYAPHEVLQSAWLPSVMRDVVGALNVEREAGESAATPQFAQEAFHFLVVGALGDTAPPLVAPLNDGGIQLEWHRGGLDVEVVFSPDDEERGVWVRDQQSGEEMVTSLDPQVFRDRIAPRLELRQ